MNTTPQDTPNTLAAAMQQAVLESDLDRACLLVQEVLGVTDGGVAGLVFSSLSEDPNGERTAWANMSPAERHKHLIFYISSELRYLPEPGAVPPLTLPGFEPHQTGGGCMALARHLPDGSQWLVTDEDGTRIPGDNEIIAVGHYDPEGSVLFEQDFAAGTFDVPAFLAMVDQSNPDAADSPAQDRAAFAAFQASRKEMSALEYGNLIGDFSWEDTPEMKLLVYNDRWNIEVCDDGRYQLVIENLCWITSETRSLEDLEWELFQFSKIAG